ncbi:MAG: hypothetical protein ACXWPK_17115, partial [Isosphaeraceae bacterium]
LKHVHYIYSIDLAKLFFDSSSDHDGPEGDLECLRTASPVGNRLGGQEKNGWFAARASRSRVDAFRCSQTLHENEDVVSSLQ